MSSRLTPSEHDVLVRLASGATYKQVARQRGSSFSTVRTHVHNAYRKLNVNTAMQAVTLAIREGWLEDYTGAPYATDDQSRKLAHWTPNPA